MDDNAVNSESADQLVVPVICCVRGEGVQRDYAVNLVHWLVILSWCLFTVRIIS